MLYKFKVINFSVFSPFVPKDYFSKSTDMRTDYISHYNLKYIIYVYELDENNIIMFNIGQI